MFSLFHGKERYSDMLEWLLYIEKSMSDINLHVPSTPKCTG